MSAKINSTSTAAPALTIENGANVSFSGSLEVKTGNADQYAIRNNGILTITGASTTITSTNTNGSSDKGMDVSAGSVQIHLSKGMYLVKIGEKTYKIVIRY